MGKVLSRCWLAVILIGGVGCRDGFLPVEAPCGEVDCGLHGSCAVFQDQPLCLCESGYREEGLSCVENTHPCDGITCSDLGICGVTMNGDIQCACRPGYHNEGPLACVPDQGSGNCLDASDCDDSDPCTDDLCQPTGECLNPYNQAPCDDGDPSTHSDSCLSGECTGTAYSCDDGNPCTDDLPDGTGNCRNTFNSDPCDDGLTCTENDLCDGAGNCDGSPIDCSAFDGPCVQGACQEPGGCYSDPTPLDGQPCDDLDDCTHTDQCSAGGCSGSWYSCDDSDPCTDDACDGDGGCLGPVYNTAPCDDGLNCTENDVCDGAGNCAGAATSCGCLEDSCNTAGCNDASGDCVVTPDPLDSPCSPNWTGANYVFCGAGNCTHGCNATSNAIGDGDHECPTTHRCLLYDDADGSGICEPNSGGPKADLGEACGADADCRSNFCCNPNLFGGYPWCNAVGIPWQCISNCTSDIDCVTPLTPTWRCFMTRLTSGGGYYFHIGVCRPPLANGATGDPCASHDDCRNGYCASFGECQDLCCTSDDCPLSHTCYFQARDGDSYIKVCKPEPTGSLSFGEPCTPVNWYDANCYEGLCLDMGDGMDRCSSMCCRDSDCPAGHRCDLTFTPQGYQYLQIRTCKPIETSCP